MVDLLAKKCERALPVTVLDRFYGPRLRFWMSKVFSLIFVALSVATALFEWGTAHIPDWLLMTYTWALSFVLRLPGVHIERTNPIYVPVFPGATFQLSGALGSWNGVLLAALGAYLLTKMLDAFARSSYYAFEAAAERGSTTPEQYVVAQICASAKHGDLVGGYLASDLGFVSAIRSGLTADQISEFIRTRTEVKDYRSVEELSEARRFADLAALVARDAALRECYSHVGRDTYDLVLSAQWVERRALAGETYDRFWGKTALSRKPSLGEDLAYGEGYKLKRYATRISVPVSEAGTRYGGEDVMRLEEALMRDAGRNALLVAPALHVAERVVSDFCRDIVYCAHPNLAHKHCWLFDVAFFCKYMSDASGFEGALGDTLMDAARMGNTILVIDDLPALVVRAEQLGANLAGALRAYLGSESPLQVIALAGSDEYHRVLANIPELSEHFHDIHLAEPERDGLVELLEDVADRMESLHGIYFTIPALREVVKDAERTLVHGLLIDRATEIMEGVPPYLQTHKKRYVIPEDVDAFVSGNAHVAVGSVTDSEREKLLHLESALHESIIGQDMAIDAIASAMRRARAGVRNENKPTASFLFFGPTGVGKTESAKTLARVFFGGEDKLLRFDMSEFSDASALRKLIGTPEGEPGAMPPVLRDHPYGVLLLDEFEKADRAVHDLFLQVLDEGIFHDGQGKPVNCRNLIIIATSNAGAVQIHEHQRGGGKFDDAFAHMIVDDIVARGEFRPELVNRFDAAICFTPIDEDGYRKIATLMLEKLAKRMREHGVILVVNEPLVAVIMQKGVDPVYGARPMQRAIQDIVEKAVAEKLLRGKAGPGVPVEFTAQELGI